MRPGDKVLYWSSSMEDFLPHEVLKLTDKNVCLEVWDRKRGELVKKWIPYDRMALIPCELHGPEAPRELVATHHLWAGLTELEPESGYHTIGAGIRCVLRSRYWLIRAASSREGKYLPSVATVCSALEEIGATEIEFDSGHLD